MLKKVAVKYGHHNWDQIADKLGVRPDSIGQIAS
jgi:hypothetical protein